MACKNVQKFVLGVRCLRSGAMHTSLMLYHCSVDPQEVHLPFEWYEKAFPKVSKLTKWLKHVDMIDGRLVNVEDGSIIIDDHIVQKMRTFKSLARVFIGSPSVQQSMKNNQEALPDGAPCVQFSCFEKQSEREPIIVNSLTKVANVLNVSAQQRKLVRLTICPQVTQHRIWTGALKEILKGLKSEMDTLYNGYPGKGTIMGPQIVSSCLKFLADSAISCDPDSTSWMRIAPAKTIDPPDSGKWEDVLEMFNDLIKCLECEKGLLYHVGKLEVMKEGLAQIKNVLVDKSIGYKEVRHQESLVQKKLSKTLGHSSQCLFTLLLYYLYGRVRDIEVDVCGGIYGGGEENKFYLCMGRILTSNEEKVVWSGVKQLDRALGLFKFVWETAGMKGNLQLQGHLWCVGPINRTLIYRGNSFAVHGINL